MNKQERFIQLENQLYNFYAQREVPVSFENAIKNSFDISVVPNKKYKFTMPRIIAYILSILTLTTGMVFAKDIVKFFSSRFTNSTQAIDTAVENGYIQNIDMDFIYDNDIGMKIDYILMDDSNLDVSFVYDTDDSNISKVMINEFIIRDENSNVIGCKLNDWSLINNQEKYEGFTCNRTKEENFRESILCKNPNMPQTKNLIIEVKSLEVTQKDLSKTDITGNWIFNINLEEKILNRSLEEYTASYSKYIDSISAKLTETSLKIEINLNTKLDTRALILDPFNIVLKNNLNERYSQSYYFYDDYYMVMEYDISKYDENIDNLNLYLRVDEDKDIDIVLVK